MIDAITNTLLRKIKCRDKVYDIRDSKLKRFILRVYPSGRKIYRCECGKTVVTLGNAEVLTPAQARDKARVLLGKVANGEEPRSKLKRALTLNQYLQTEYNPWRIQSKETGEKDVKRIKQHFSELFGNTCLEDISLKKLEKWCIQRLSKEINPATLNRDVGVLKTALAKAVEWEIIHSHPLIKFKLYKIDQNQKTRYLSTEEEKQLRNALDGREQKTKAERSSANQWRIERQYTPFPIISENQYVDHLKPMVVLSLNTGIRRGELFCLTWDNVDLVNAMITIKKAKNGQTRHIHLNSEAISILQIWHKQHGSPEIGLVFPNKENQPFNNVRKSWVKVLYDANIQDFRWHDLRHHFASKLVMSGVDLNTVRELLGHSDIKMTLRYAHLSNEHKANAVEALCLK